MTAMADATGNELNLQLADTAMEVNPPEQGLAAYVHEFTGSHWIATRSGTDLQYEIHVDFHNDMWWAMPHWLSDPIVEKWLQGYKSISFVWDWKNTRRGS